jgi:hypothetical protein
MGYPYRDIMEVYREAERQIAEEKRQNASLGASGRRRPNDRNDRSPAKPAGSNSRYRAAFAALERRCPANVGIDRWQQAVEDGRRLLGQWSEQAASLGWTVDDLFGLHQPPTNPHSSYDRLSRYDCLGLVWSLLGRPVVILTAESAIIKTRTDTVAYRKNCGMKEIDTIGR